LLSRENVTLKVLRFVTPYLSADYQGFFIHAVAGIIREQMGLCTMSEVVGCTFQKLCPDDTVLINASPGKIIYSPDQRVDYIYHLHTGLAKGIGTMEDGKEITVAIKLPQHLISIAGFARMSSGKTKFHIWEVRAVTAVTYCKVRSSAVWGRLDDLKARAEIFSLVTDLMVADTIYTTLLAYQDMAKRVLGLLRLLGRFIGRYDEQGQVIIQGISHDDIASLINSSRPTVTHMLDQMQSKGIIRLEQKKIVFLRDYESLQVDIPSNLQRDYFSKPLR
jgi:CRP-like cAMP-binding protein